MTVWLYAPHNSEARPFILLTPPSLTLTILLTPHISLSHSPSLHATIHHYSAVAAPTSNFGQTEGLTYRCRQCCAFKYNSMLVHKAERVVGLFVPRVKPCHDISFVWVWWQSQMNIHAHNCSEVDENSCSVIAYGEELTVYKKKKHGGSAISARGDAYVNAIKCSSRHWLEFI